MTSVCFQDITKPAGSTRTAGRPGEYGPMGIYNVLHAVLGCPRCSAEREMPAEVEITVRADVVARVVPDSLRPGYIS